MDFEVSQADNRTSHQEEDRELIVTSSLNLETALEVKCVTVVPCIKKFFVVIIFISIIAHFGWTYEFTINTIHFY